VNELIARFRDLDELLVRFGSAAERRIKARESWTEQQLVGRLESVNRVCVGRDQELSQELIGVSLRRQRGEQYGVAEKREAPMVGGQDDLTLLQ
jgi:hypothetical protein